MTLSYALHWMALVCTYACHFDVGHATLYVSRLQLHCEGHPSPCRSPRRGLKSGGKPPPPPLRSVIRDTPTRCTYEADPDGTLPE